MSREIPKIDDRVRTMLEESGTPYKVVPRRRHHQLVVGGQCVAVLSRARSEMGGRKYQNMLACVRRAIRNFQQEENAR